MSKRLPLRTLDDTLEALEASETELEALVLAMATASKCDAASDAFRAHLMASLEQTHRFDDLKAQVALLLDVDGEQAARFLLNIDRASTWSPGPIPGVDIYHVEGGPLVEEAVTGFVRLGAGATFPEHEHLGDETVLVLQGALIDSHGRQVRAGEAAPMSAGSRHAFRAVGSAPLIYLAVIQRGVRIGDVEILAGDPAA